MARKPRIFYSGAIYHVMLRGNGGEKIFFSNSDRKHFYSLIREGIERFVYQVHAFCLMSNHVHLAIQTTDIPLSKIMHNIGFRYTQWINHHQNKKGHLFQGRYKAILIEDDAYLLEVVRYIHLNPVKANIVQCAEDYQWSSHRAYLGMAKLNWVSTNKVLNMLAVKPGLARIKLREFIAKQNESQGAEKNAEIDDIILFERSPKIQPVDCAATTLSLPQIISTVCMHQSISESELYDNKHTRRHADIRAKIGWLARETGTCTLTEVAKLFEKDVSGLIRKIYQMESIPWVLNELNMLKFALNKSRSQA